MTSIAPSTTGIVVAGDWHGDISWVSHALRMAKAEGIDTIVQVGDFGYWEHEKEGVYYLDKMNENAALRGVNIVWLDGNHENHTLLHQRYADAEKSDEGFWKIRDHVWYSPRGNAWDWWGKRLMTLGGAFSIDRQWRVFEKSWWPGEVITPEQEALAISQGKIDYFFTHDSPTNIPMELFKNDYDSQANRAAVSRVAEACRPSVWFHGHYHRKMDYSYPEYDPFVRVVGLQMNGEYHNLRVFDLLSP
jgi:predicted phosphodiesterase